MAMDEAFVTCATNDTYALGALVLAHSLRNVKTSKQLAVIITRDVSQKMRGELQGIYDFVEEVNVLDSRDEANLALLSRPELGVTFTKFHCWRLTRYKKCVFLDADTLVLKNCDELLEHEELSAVPDVGWPDCFNSGVFVFRPNDETYRAILKMAVEKGSFDGGDQGVLNMYFSDWRTKDISRHLSFIYNMNSNATYSYQPAFRRFGKDVKIVHFLGPIKPWMQDFNVVTGRVEPDDLTQHSQEHLQMWWNIFTKHVQPGLTEECKGLAGALSRMYIDAPSGERSITTTSYDSFARQYAWERGQIDYMGVDAFDNIERKLDSSINGGQKQEP